MNNTSLIVSFVVIALVALIPPIVLFLSLKKNEVHGQGAIANWSVTVGGPIAAYIVIVGIIVYQLLPIVIIDPNKIEIESNWNISFKPTGQNTSSITGVVSSFKNKSDLMFSGILNNKDSDKLQMLSKFGEVIEKERRFISLFEILGSRGKTRGVINGSLLKGKSNIIEANYNLLNGEDLFSGAFGTVTLVRKDQQLNWLSVLCILVLIPLFSSLVLWKLLPGNSTIAEGDQQGVHYKLGGPIAAYVVIFLLFNISFKYLSSSLTFEIPEKESETPYNICGLWAYKNYPFDPNGVSGAGKVKISQNNTKISLNGELKESQMHPAAPWKSRFGFVSKDGEVMFYYEVQNGDGSNGIEYGSLLSTSPDEFTLEWNDLQASWDSNRGRTVFKKQKECDI